jgi:hypothetical protein
MTRYASNVTLKISNIYEWDKSKPIKTRMQTTTKWLKSSTKCFGF